MDDEETRTWFIWFAHRLWARKPVAPHFNACAISETKIIHDMETIEQIKTKVILIDPSARTISKTDDQLHDELCRQIYLRADDAEHKDYVAAVDGLDLSSVIVASDCGFILRFDGQKFIVPGRAVIERISWYDNLDRMDTPYEVADFVISKTEVKGKFAIEWL